MAGRIILPGEFYDPDDEPDDDEEDIEQTSNTDEDVSGPWEELAKRVRADLRAAGNTLGTQEVRYLVDTYYSIQDFRIQAQGQQRAMVDDAEPHEATKFISLGTKWLEESIKAVLDRYTATEPTGMGKWARGVTGIGPVLSAGLLAHRVFDAQYPTVGHTWAFAGLAPGVVWAKGQKRPWNAKLKVLCWKIGESFVKVQNRKADIYGHVYANRKLYEQYHNERKRYADQAAAKLERFKIGHDTDAYKSYIEGMLPKAHIHARARRYAVKAFLSDYWGEAYRRIVGGTPPLPYPISQLGHAHFVEGGQWVEASARAVPVS